MFCNWSDGDPFWGTAVILKSFAVLGRSGLSRFRSSLCLFILYYIYLKCNIYIYIFQMIYIIMEILLPPNYPLRKPLSFLPGQSCQAKSFVRNRSFTQRAHNPTVHLWKWCALFHSYTRHSHSLKAIIYCTVIAFMLMNLHEYIYKHTHVNPCFLSFWFL